MNPCEDFVSRLLVVQWTKKDQQPKNNKKTLPFTNFYNMKTIWYAVYVKAVTTVCAWGF